MVTASPRSEKYLWGLKHAWSGTRKREWAWVLKQRFQVWAGGHSLGDLSVKAFQLGVKASHQLKHLLLGIGSEGQSGRKRVLEVRVGTAGQFFYLHSHSKIVAILNPGNLQLQPGGDLQRDRGGARNGIKVPSRFPPPGLTAHIRERSARSTLCLRA